MCPFVEKQLSVPAEKTDYTFLQIRLLPGILQILGGKNVSLKEQVKKKNLTALRHQKARQYSLTQQPVTPPAAR